MLHLCFDTAFIYQTFQTINHHHHPRFLLFRWYKLSSILKTWVLFKFRSRLQVSEIKTHQSYMPMFRGWMTPYKYFISNLTVYSFVSRSCSLCLFICARQSTPSAEPSIKNAVTRKPNSLHNGSHNLDGISIGQKSGTGWVLT